MLVKADNKESPVRFLLIFLGLFGLFYYFNIFFFGVTSPGNHYSEFLAKNLNYISWLRHILLSVSAQIINWTSLSAITNDYELLVAGHGTIQLVYTCLGLGIMSFFSAFVIAFPKKTGSKLYFLLGGLIAIQLLNIVRFVLLAIFWDKKSKLIVDHHTIFNIIIYVITAVSIYFWVKKDDQKFVSGGKI